MSAANRTARDPYRFALRGMTGINNYAFVPAIADDALDASRLRRARPAGRRARLVAALEDFLARCYAPGCHGAAGDPSAAAAGTRPAA